MFGEMAPSNFAACRLAQVPRYRSPACGRSFSTIINRSHPWKQAPTDVIGVGGLPQGASPTRQTGYRTVESILEHPVSSSWIALASLLRVSVRSVATAAPPGHEVRGERDDLLLEVVARDELLEHDDALAAELGCWCVDCGERRCGVLA